MTDRMRTEFVQKESYVISDLLEIMRLLRSENGCPWDREQTHASIRQSMIEEAYETADAIDQQNKEMLCEELGDVLLQVVFHAQIGQEDGTFCFDDVVDGICKKLVERHPHVFGSVIAETSDAVLQNWEAIKQKSKHQNSVTDTLVAVPTAFPALMRAQKVQKRAAKSGRDVFATEHVFDEIHQKTDLLQKETEQEKRFELLGSLLLSVVGAARSMDLDCELAMTRATDAFIETFAKNEIM